MSVPSVHLSPPPSRIYIVVWYVYGNMAQISVHDGKCGACHLCGKESTKYVHLAVKSDCNVAALIRATKTTPNEACICHACYKQASRNKSNPNFHPRWEEKPPTTVLCGILTCTKGVYRHSNIASRQEIEEIVGEKVVTNTSMSVDSDGSTPLPGSPLSCSHQSKGPTTM